VYTPVHDAAFWQLGVLGARRVIDLWAERTMVVGARADVACVLPFENREPMRSWILPSEAFAGSPPTDGGGFHVHGVPRSTSWSLPPTWSTRRTPSARCTNPASKPLSWAAARIVDSLHGRMAAELGAGCRPSPVGG
jgi:hypothetical protein